MRKRAKAIINKIFNLNKEEEYVIDEITRLDIFKIYSSSKAYKRLSEKQKEDAHSLIKSLFSEYMVYMCKINSRKRVYVYANPYTSVLGDGTFLTQAPIKVQDVIKKNIGQYDIELDETRYGYLDLVKLKYFCELVNADIVIIKNVHAIENLSTLKLCSTYIYGTDITRFHLKEEYLKKCKPIYYSIKVDIKDLKQLNRAQNINRKYIPKAYKEYIDYVEKTLKVRVECYKN